MRPSSLVAVLCLAMGPAAAAGAADAQPMAPVKAFIDSFNKGDAAAAAATHAPNADLAIIDEVAPYLWRGPQAFQTWSTALENESKKRGITDQVVTISAPTREEMEGDQAYVVVPAVYTYREGGVAMQEKAQMTFALKKGASGWLIHGWTWSGPKPKAVAPAKP